MSTTDTAMISSDDGLTISRTMPAILSNRISNTYWNSFCDELDEALKPAAEMKKISNWLRYVRLGSWVLFAVILVLGFTISLGGYYWIVLVIVIAGEVGAQHTLEKVYRGIHKKVMKGLREACGRASASYPGIVFSARDDTEIFNLMYSRDMKCFGNRKATDVDYITVSIDPNTSSTTSSTPIAKASIVGDPSAPPIVQAFSIVEPSAPPNVSSASIGYEGSSDYPESTLFGGKNKKSSAERMRELDAMKDRLTEDEYYAKRAEILSDV